MMSTARHPLLSRFIAAIESIAPLRLADRSWDNVGLLLESPTVALAGATATCNVLLTIDLTGAVLEEAVSRGASIVLSYHPTWFHPAKALTLDDAGGPMKVIALAASQGISIYSPHSALDAIRGGRKTHAGRRIRCI